MLWDLVRNKPLNKHRREYDDMYQKRLESKLENLSQALVNLQPALFAQLIMRIKKNREVLAEAIGQPLRGLFLAAPEKPRSFLEMFNFAIQNMRSALKAHDWSHHFPRNRVEKIAALKTTSSGRKKAERKLLKIMRKVLIRESNKLLENIATNILKAIERFFNRLFKGHAKVKKIIRSIIRYLIQIPVYLVLKLLHLIFLAPILAVLAIYISQNKNRADDLTLDIHDNLFYHVIGEIMQLIVNHQNLKPKPA